MAGPAYVAFGPDFPDRALHGCECTAERMIRDEQSDSRIYEGITPSRTEALATLMFG